MEETAKNSKEILIRLAKLQAEIEYIKQHMVDVDIILTEEERIMLDESIEHEKKGKLISLEELENVRNKAR